MVGFSAGAMLTMATALAGEDAGPAFIGNIYGPLAPVTVPADAPPSSSRSRRRSLLRQWRLRADRTVACGGKMPAELHLY